VSDVLPKRRRRGYRVLSLSELVALDSRRIPGKKTQMKTDVPPQPPR
jgi:hypothetical protein